MKYIGIKRSGNLGDIWVKTNDQVYVCVNRYKSFYLTQAQIDHDVFYGYLRPLNEKYEPRHRKGHKSQRKGYGEIISHNEQVLDIRIRASKK